MIPIEIQEIILTYVVEILMFEKLEFAATEFLHYFGVMYAPIAAGEMSDPGLCNDILAAGEMSYHPGLIGIRQRYAEMECRFKRSEIMFNRFVSTMRTVAQEPEYWIHRIMESIDWNGVALMNREAEGYEFIKLHGKWSGEGNGVLSTNGYTIINLSDYEFIHDP